MNTLLSICMVFDWFGPETWASTLLSVVLIICVTILIMFLPDIVYKYVCKCRDSKKKNDEEIDNLKVALKEANSKRREQDLELKIKEFYEIELVRKFADNKIKGNGSNFSEEIENIKKEIDELKKVKKKTIEIFVNKQEDKPI